MGRRRPQHVLGIKIPLPTKEEQLKQSKEESERFMQAVSQEAFEGKYSEESDREVSVA